MNSAKHQTIIQGIKEGDYQILKAFYKKNLPHVRKFILKHHGRPEDVEDIFQEAVVVLYHKLRTEKLETKVMIDTYFAGICKNMWRNQLRKQQLIAYQNWLVDTSEDTEASILETLLLEDQQALYQKYHAQLNPTSSQLLQLFFEGKNMKTIASYMGYSEGYTRKKKHLIKNRLLQGIQQDPVYEELVAS